MVRDEAVRFRGGGGELMENLKSVVEPILIGLRADGHHLQEFSPVLPEALDPEKDSFWSQICCVRCQKTLTVKFREATFSMAGTLLTTDRCK
jgi:hypothetical protein